MTDPRKPWTGNPSGGKVKIPRDTYERMIRAFGKEPKPPGTKTPPHTGAGSHD